MLGALVVSTFFTPKERKQENYFCDLNVPLV
jgi:hypothetical protein